MFPLFHFLYLILIFISSFSFYYEIFPFFHFFPLFHLPFFFISLHSLILIISFPFFLLILFSSFFIYPLSHFSPYLIFPSPISYYSAYTFFPHSLLSYLFSFFISSYSSLFRLSLVPISSNPLFLLFSFPSSIFIPFPPLPRPCNSTLP